MWANALKNAQTRALWTACMHVVFVALLNAAQPATLPQIALQESSNITATQLAAAQAPQTAPAARICSLLDTHASLSVSLLEEHS